MNPNAVVDKSSRERLKSLRLVASQVCRLTRTFVEAERRFAIVAPKDKDAKGFYDRIPSIERSRGGPKARQQPVKGDGPHPLGAEEA